MASFHIFFTIVMLIIFTGIFLWAYSKRRKNDFDAAARLPFADEENCDGKNKGERT